MKINRKMMKFFAVLSAVFCSAGLYAQMNTSPYYPEFTPDPDSDMAYIEKENSYKTKGIQYGGWLSPAFMQKHADDTSALSVNVARLWAKAYLWNNAHVYVRGKNTFSIMDIPDENELDNIIDLDVAYLDMLFLDQQLQVTLGRKYFYIGTGLVLNGRGDGGEVNYTNPYFSVRGLVNYTGLLQKDDNPYGLSIADFSDGAERLFLGLVLSKDIQNQHVYAFGLGQMDLADKEKAEEYNSWYFGLGARGFILTRFGYYAEFVYETGKSYDRTETEQDINAIAISAGLDFKFRVVTEPLLLIEYTYGSGDKDRNDSGENSEGKDKFFTSFGTFNGGYGLNPTLGNLHVMRAGFSFQPFDWVNSTFIRRMSIAAKYSYYMKDQSSAPINTSEAKIDDRFVGQGADVSLRWRLFSDIGLFANYGIFLPGDAFESDASKRHFIFAGLNISF